MKDIYKIKARNGKFYITDEHKTTIEEINIFGEVVKTRKLHSFYIFNYLDTDDDIRFDFADEFNWELKPKLNDNNIEARVNLDGYIKSECNEIIAVDTYANEDILNAVSQLFSSYPSFDNEGWFIGKNKNTKLNIMDVLNNCINGVPIIIPKNNTRYSIYKEESDKIYLVETKNKNKIHCIDKTTFNTYFEKE